MTEERFKLQLCSNGTYYVYENGTLTDIDFDKFNKESADALIDEVNALYEENEQLRHDATVLIQANQDYRRENDKIKSLLLKKVKDLNNDYQQSAKNGMPTGGIIGELDSFEEICEIMGWKND